MKSSTFFLSNEFKESWSFSSKVRSTGVDLPNVVKVKGVYFSGHLKEGIVYLKFNLLGGQGILCPVIQGQVNVDINHSVAGFSLNSDHEFTLVNIDGSPSPQTGKLVVILEFQQG